MANFLSICYKPCEPAPANGYRVEYRPSGSDEALRTWPANFFPTSQELVDGVAQAALQVTADPDGTQYEGVILGDCPGGLGVGVPWTTGDNPPPESDSSVPPTPEPGTGNLDIDGCFDDQGDVRISDISFNGETVGTNGGFPMDAGNSDTATVPAAGTHTLTVSVTGFVLAFGRVVVTDSTGAVSCQAISGLPTTKSFPAFVILDDVPWTVHLDCGGC